MGLCISDLPSIVALCPAGCVVAVALESFNGIVSNIDGQGCYLPSTHAERQRNGDAIRQQTVGVDGEGLCGRRQRYQTEWEGWITDIEQGCGRSEGDAADRLGSMTLVGYGYREGGTLVRMHNAWYIVEICNQSWSIEGQCDVSNRGV